MPEPMLVAGDSPSNRRINAVAMPDAYRRHKIVPCMHVGKLTDNCGRVIKACGAILVAIDMELEPEYESVEAEFTEPYVTSFTVGFDGKPDRIHNRTERQQSGYDDGLACRQILKEQGML